MINENEPSLFELNTVSKKVGDRFYIECRKGLWSVEAPTKSQATVEAVRYFLQYQRDGEYD